MRPFGLHLQGSQAGERQRGRVHSAGAHGLDVADGRLHLLGGEHALVDLQRLGVGEQAVAHVGVGVDAYAQGEVGEAGGVFAHVRAPGRWTFHGDARDVQAHLAGLAGALAIADDYRRP